MKTFIGIDNGTQSTKVIFFDIESEKIVATASSPHRLISKEDGSREQEASWWIEALADSFNKIDPAIKKTAVAVGVSGQQHGFVPLDSAGNVLTPVKLWCDTSTGSQCNTINSRVGGIERIIEIAGNPVYAGYTASKILWLKETHPELYKKMTTILLPHDYLNFILTGNRVMEYGDASGTALLDIENRVWSREVVSALDPDRDLMDALPKLIEPYETAGVVTSEAAAKFGIPKGIIVSSGGGDNMIAAIGTGVVSDGVMTMSMGTSGTLYGYSDKPVIDRDGNIAAFCSSTGGYLPLLCTMNCTVSTEIMRKLLSIDVKEIDETASKSEPGSGGLITIPFFNGERTPNLPNGKGTLLGMDATNVTKENILRSSMEAAVFGMRFGLESFIKLGFTPKEIILTGGGSKSLVWRQIAADIMNTTIVVTNNSEAGALGAAIQALWAYNHLNGGETDIESLSSSYCKGTVEQRYEPGPAVEKYNEVYATYMEYLDRLSVLFR